jgi:hypothetical protein
VIVDGNGNDWVDGGGGHDAVIYDRPREDYSVQFANGFALVTDLVGNGGTDTLSEVEWIVFTNDVIVV